MSYYFPETRQSLLLVLAFFKQIVYYHKHRISTQRFITRIKLAAHSPFQHNFSQSNLSNFSSILFERLAGLCTFTYQLYSPHALVERAEPQNIKLESVLLSNI